MKLSYFHWQNLNVMVLSCDVPTLITTYNQEHHARVVRRNWFKSPSPNLIDAGPF